MIGSLYQFVLISLVNLGYRKKKDFSILKKAL